MVTWGPCGHRRGNQFVKNANNQIEMYRDDVCLDISAGNDTLGGYVMAQKCNSAKTKRFINQKWSFESLKPEWLVIRTQMSSGKVLDASRKNASPTGTGVVMKDYDKNAITQKWYSEAGDVIRSAVNDYCLVSNGILKVSYLEKKNLEFFF